MAALWLLIVLAHAVFVDRGLCVPVDAKQEESNAGLKKDVSHDDSLKKAFELLHSFDSMLKQQNKVKPAAEVELDDQVSHNVSNIQQQNVISSQPNNSFSNQESYNMSNALSQQLTNGQQQSYNMSNNPAAQVDFDDYASHNLTNGHQESYNLTNGQQNTFSHQQSYNLTNGQQSYNLTNGQQVVVSQPNPMNHNLSSNFLNDFMDDSAEVYTINV
ncbi:uncharacterized protein LOC144038187 [Vanacampus margaritifer]